MTHHTARVPAVTHRAIELEVRTTDLPDGICGRVQGIALTYNATDAYGTMFALGATGLAWLWRRSRGSDTGALGVRTNAGFATGADLRPGWDAVERDDMERLCDAVVHHLQIEDGVSRGVGNAPEFALARLHLDDRGRLCWIGDGDIVERDVP